MTCLRRGTPSLPHPPIFSLKSFAFCSLLRWHPAKIFIIKDLAVKISHLKGLCINAKKAPVLAEAFLSVFSIANGMELVCNWNVSCFVAVRQDFGLTGFVTFRREGDPYGIARRRSTTTAPAAVWRVKLASCCGAIRGLCRLCRRVAMSILRRR